MDKQLNVWIPEELKVYVAERAEHERKGRNTIIAELIQQDMARRNGEIIEQQSLPIIREIIQSELRKTAAQLHKDLLADFLEEIKELLQHYLDRLAKLIVRTMRDGGIIRRLVYTSLSRAYGKDFALKAYTDAKADAGQELARPQAKERKDEE